MPPAFLEPIKHPDRKEKLLDVAKSAALTRLARGLDSGTEMDVGSARGHCSDQIVPGAHLIERYQIDPSTNAGRF